MRMREGPGVRSMEIRCGEEVPGSRPVLHIVSPQASIDRHFFHRLTCPDDHLAHRPSPRRRQGGRGTMPAIIRLIAAVAVVVAATAPAAAQAWPGRPLTLVVPFAAGGPMDTIGRILALRLGEPLRQQVVVENVGGAGGMTGAARVAKAAPDGYQFVLGNLGTHAASQTFYKSPLYNAATDFAPVGLIAEVPFVLVTRKDLPAGNLQEFAAYAGTNQDRMQYGSGGSGSATHLACVLLNSALGAA